MPLATERKTKRLTKDDLEDLSIRYSSAYSINLRYIDRLIDAVRLTAPLSDGLDILYGFHNEGQKVDRRIYDSTAQYCSSVRANNLHSLIWPLGKHWSSVYTVDDDDPSQETFNEEVTNKAFRYIENSNLHSVAKAYFQDVNIGCAALWVDSPSKERPLLFKNLTGVTLMPEYSDDPEQVNIWFHKRVSWYELYNINKSVAVKHNSKKESGEMNTFDIVCGYLDMTETHGGYLLIQYLKGEMDEPIDQTWCPYNQLILTNDNVRAGEARGQGVTMVNLEKIKYINSLTEKLKAYVDYHAEPALIVDDRIPNRIHELKGARIPSDLIREEGRVPIQPLEWRLEIQAVEAMLQAERNQIMQIYNINPLGMPEDTPKATATEVGLRNAMAERQTTADLSRIAKSSINVLKVVVDILTHRGLIKLTDNSKIRLKFDSPEVDIQSSEEVNTVLQYASVIGNTFGPQAFALHNDQQKFDDYIRNKLKVSKSFASTPEQVIDKSKALLQSGAGDQESKDQGNQQIPLGQSQFEPATPVSPTQTGDKSIGGLGL